MQRAALYIRVSTDDQVEYSPDAQKRLLLEYALKNDMIADDDYIYLDDGYSGRKAEKRPAFMQMIAAAKSKPAPFDVILVHKFDRFARSREDSVVYKSLLKKDGVKVISITEHLEDDKFSIILESMLEAMAEYYSINLSEEVKKGMTEKALRGEVQTAPPYGYIVKDNMYIVEPEEAKTVQYIFDRISSGDTSFYRIAKDLNDMGKRTKKGNKWRNKYVEYIAHNYAYIGKIAWSPDGRKHGDYNKEALIIRDGKHTPIVSTEQFNDVQKILGNKIVLRKNQQPCNTYKHWMSGLLFCDTCSASLCFNNSRSPGWQCRGYAGGECKVSHRISVKKVETAVFASLNDILSGNNTNYSTVNKNEMKDGIERRTIEKAIEKTVIKLQRAKQTYLDGIDTIEEYKENKANIQAEKEKLSKELQKFKITKINEKHFKEQAENLYQLLKSDASLEEKSNATHQLIEKVVYVKSEERLEFSYYV